MKFLDFYFLRWYHSTGRQCFDGEKKKSGVELDSTTPLIGPAAMKHARAARAHPTKGQLGDKKSAATLGPKHLLK
jgi:hypothetical protein